MKKSTIIFIVIIFLVQTNLFAQLPETFNYQAVARSEDGSPVTNKEVILEVSIIQGTNCETASNCNIVWQEIHNPTTNEFGLFSIQIGDGQSTYEGSSSDFLTIDWYDFTSGSYYLKMRVDFGSSEFGSGLIDMGTIKLQSVPYSLVAENSEDIVRDGNGDVPFGIEDLNNIDFTSNPATNEVILWNGSNWTNATVSSGGAIALTDLTDVTVTATANHVLFSNGTNWINQQLDFDNLASVGTPSANQIFFHDGTNWTQPVLNLDLLDGVNTTGATTGQILTFDGSNWVSQDATGGSSLWTQNTSPTYINSPDGSGILSTGTYNTGTAISSVITGAGVRMMFDPKSASFRAGRISTGTAWDENNIGNYSVAFGRNTTASGTASAAFGQNNDVNGENSFSIGTANDVAGDNSFSVGSNNIVSRHGSIAFGSGNTIEQNADGALAGGLNTVARGQYSASFGNGNSSQSQCSFYVGRFANVTGDQVAWVATDPLIVAGNGTGSGATNDAMVLLKSGGLYLDLTLFENQKSYKNSKSINKSLDNILLLDALSYQTDDKTTFGFDANELEKIYPELVSNNTNGGKSISYTRFTPVLVQSIKEQQEIILEIKEENLSLKQENQDLKQKYEDLNKRLEKLETEN